MNNYNIESNKSEFDFPHLSKILNSVHEYFYTKTVKSINQNLTLRNWLFGWYIIEYEQNGNDRAKYGEKLISNLAKSLHNRKISATTLKISRQFYLIYPQISQTLSDRLPAKFRISGKSQTASDHLGNDIIEPSVLLKQLSFSHFTELIKIKDNHKRVFYEIECIRSSWNVRELKKTNKHIVL